MSEQYLRFPRGDWMEYAGMSQTLFTTKSGGILLRVCDLSTNQPCVPNYAGPACTVLQACKSSQCGSMGNQPESLQLCAMKQCTENFVQCYGTACVQWADPLFRDTSYMNSSLVNPPQPLDAHYQDQAQRYAAYDAAWRSPTAFEPFPEPSNFGVTAGVCLLQPSVGDCDPSTITRIPMHGLGPLSNDTSRLPSFSTSRCDGRFATTYGLALPGESCQNGDRCLLTKCFRDVCDPADSSAREVAYYGKVVAAPVAAALLLALCVWRVRQVQRMKVEGPAPYRGERQWERGETHWHSLGPDANQLPTYRQTPGATETRLEYNVAEEVDMGVGEIEMHTIAVQSTPTGPEPSSVS
ncbi:hypothetical protein RI367_004046 [Sorochytrium milnesiophthora]